MKRILAILLAGLLCLSLAACGDGNQSSSGTANQTGDGEDIEVTIPALIVGDGGAELQAQTQELGFKSSRQNDDGSVTYTIAKEDQPNIVATMKMELDASCLGLAQGESFQSVHDYRTNDDYTEITLIVDREGFESTFDALAPISLSIEAVIYQLFTGNADPKVAIYVEDEETSEVFDSFLYPEDYE